MPRTSRMSNSLARTQTGTAREESSLDLPFDDISQRKVLRRQQLDKQAAKWVDAAAGAYGSKEQQFASDCEFSESHLSDMCSGERSTPIRALLVVKRDRRSLMAFLDSFLEDTDLTVSRKRKVTKRTAEVSVSRAARSIVALWPVIRQLAAEDANTDEDDLESALIEDEAVAK